MRRQIARSLTISALAAGLLVPAVASSQAAVEQPAASAVLQAGIVPVAVQAASLATTAGRWP
ncbi:hypothetical protein GQF42_00590 [Streptomyces broussonetiae]|uniref:Uncharacterized protein n=1 Tax=Streptomyces broussonetiae TaxID=2686304 RepID=A0A6I6MWT3_9ACTN|nr:hypothetical protein [Streptomyces broussonetiae]QHA02060.1 hypothetical protein GQF42_00590 [Streptomyces broussonetiae]